MQAVKAALGDSGPGALDCIPDFHPGIFHKVIDMADPTPVVIGKVTLAKGIDGKTDKAAITALTEALTAAAGKGDFKVGSVSGKDKGLEVAARIVELVHDTKKGTMSAKIEILLSTLPGPKLYSTVKGSGGFEADPRKLDKDAADLMKEIMKTTAPNVKKGLEAGVERLGS